MSVKATAAPAWLDEAAQVRLNGRIIEGLRRARLHGRGVLVSVSDGDGRGGPRSR
jgi:hypothetical protein